MQTKHSSPLSIRTMVNESSLVGEKWNMEEMREVGKVRKFYTREPV